jgi:hypothetical protein
LEFEAMTDGRSRASWADSTVVLSPGSNVVLTSGRGLEFEAMTDLAVLSSDTVIASISTSSTVIHDDDVGGILAPRCLDSFFSYMQDVVTAVKRG